MAKKETLFLLSHQPNPRFIKQVSYLSKTHNVSVVYFYRQYMKDLSCEYSCNVVLNESLGTISNGNYLKRIANYYKSLKRLKKTLKQNTYNTLIVNNIDVLILFKLATLFTKMNTKIVVEISDLRDHTYTNGFKSTVTRVIEKFAFNFVHRLIVTSPKFYGAYYSKLFKDKPFLLENKPLSNMMPKRVEKVKNKKIVIGIVGLLLQGKMYEMLFESIKGNNKYEVHIHGKGTFEDLAKEYAAKYTNIKFFGEYNFFQDIAKIYASLDAIYMPYDTTNGSLNNKIALPNKLYEAMYFQVPIITSKETYLGELVEKHEIGLAVKCCADNLIETIEKVMNVNFPNNLEQGIYLADDDYKRLLTYIDE